MKQALSVLKQKRVWIPLVILSLLFCTIAGGTYFVSRALAPASADIQEFPLSEIFFASIDSDRRKHLRKAEVAYFAAESFVADENYKLAHQNFSEACEEFAEATGKTSQVACIIALRQADFETRFGKYGEAEKILRQAKDNLPTSHKYEELHLTVNKRLAAALQWHRKFDEAIPVLIVNAALADRIDKTKKLAAGTNHLAALKALEDCYVEAEQYDNALTIARDILAIAESQPGDRKMQADAWTSIGRVKGYAGNSKAAIEAFEKAIVLDPQCKQAFRARGMTYSEGKQYPNAISDFSILIKINKEDENAYEWRAYAYELNGEKEKAIADLARAIEIGGNRQETYNNRARIYVDMGKYKEAVADLTESLQADGSPWTYLHRAKAYEHLEQYQFAIDDYSRALESKYFIAHPNHETPAGKNVIAANYKTMGSLVYARRSKCYEKLGKKNLADLDMARSARLDRQFLERKDSKKLDEHASDAEATSAKQSKDGDTDQEDSKD